MTYGFFENGLPVLLESAYIIFGALALDWPNEISLLKNKMAMLKTRKYLK
jgi:hypothetical protein